MIKVIYDGEYPNACSGNLTIIKDGEIIYDKNHCCSSTGSVWFDDEGNEHIECGKLIWDEAYLFDKEIQNAAEEELDKINVCCGGCV